MTLKHSSSSLSRLYRMSDAHDTDPFALAAEAAGVISELSGVPKHDIARTLGSGWGLSLIHI